MPKKNIPNKTSDEVSKYNHETKLTEDTASDINFFSSDIDAMNQQLSDSEKLYDEIHGLYTNCTGGEYVPNRSIRDIAELAKTLVSSRQLCADIINKRYTIKKSITDIVNRKTGVADENEMAATIAREMVATIQAGGLVQSQFKSVATSKSPSRDEQDTTELAMLDKAVNSKIKNGTIKMSTNDKLIGVSDYVEPKYNKRLGKFVAIDSRTGKIIKNFPEERLPKGKINMEDNDGVHLSSGEIVPLAPEDSQDGDGIDYSQIEFGENDEQ